MKSEKKTINLPLRIQQIQELIPHRYPFLLVDMITEFVEGEYIIGCKLVTANEPFFQGHFPGRPIMPGVLILEAMAQIGAIYGKLCHEGIPSSKIVVFSGADDVRFRRQVFPGDTLLIKLFNPMHRLAHWKLDAEARVGNELVASATVKAAEVA